MSEMFGSGFVGKASQSSVAWDTVVVGEITGVDSKWRRKRFQFANLISYNIYFVNCMFNFQMESNNKRTMYTENHQKSYCNIFQVKPIAMRKIYITEYHSCTRME